MPSMFQRRDRGMKENSKNIKIIQGKLTLFFLERACMHSVLVNFYLKYVFCIVSEFIKRCGYKYNTNNVLPCPTWEYWYQC